MSRNIAHKLLRAFLWIILGVVALVLLTPVLLYIPFVQDFAVKIATEQVAKSTGMKVEIGKLRLGFPLRLKVDNAAVIQANGDTMLTSGNLAVDVKLMPLFKGDVKVNGATLDNTFYQLGNNDSVMWIRANIAHADIEDSDISLKGGEIELSRVDINGVNVRLRMLNDTTVAPTDTTQGTPWNIRAGVIRISDLTYSMMMEPLIDSLGCKVEMMQLCDGQVDMGNRKIHGRSLKVDSVAATYFYPATTVTTSSETITDSVVTPQSEMWTITADSLHLTSNYALYAQSGVKPAAGFDPAYIQGSGIIIEVDSFYNQGTTITVPIKEISADERSGIHIHADGTFSMDGKTMNATAFNIETLKSNLAFTAKMGIGDFTTDTSLPISFKGSGRIDPTEIALAFPEMKPMLAPMRPLSLSTDIDGTSGELNIYNLNLIMPGITRLEAEGVVSNPFLPDKIGGELTLNGSLSTITDKQFSFLPIEVVPALALNGDILYQPGKASGDITVKTRQGSLAANGHWVGKRESYDAVVSLKRFPVDAFMPELGIREITADLKVDGKGYNPMLKTSFVDANIDLKSIIYQKEEYNNILLNASLHDGDATGTLVSNNKDLDGTLKFDATLDGDSVKWDMNGNIRNVNLMALNLADTVNEGHLDLTTSGKFNVATQDIDATADITGLYWKMPGITVNANAPISMSLLSESSLMDAEITNGDMNLKATSSTSLFSFISGLTAGMNEVMAQKDSMRVNVGALSQAFPTMDMVLNMGQNNIASQYLKETSDMVFRHLLFAAHNDSLLSLNVDVTGFMTGSTRLDTISFNAIQHGQYLVYRASIDNRPGTFDDFAHVVFNGFLGSNRIAAYMRQENIKGEKGFNLGLSAQIDDSVVTVKLVPQKPTIAYKSWTVNDNNYISFDLVSKHLDADLALSNDKSYLKIFTEHPVSDATEDSADYHHEHPAMQEDLIVQLSQIHLQDWLAINPFAPPVKGDVSANMRLRYDNNILTAKGNVGLDDLYYGKERVGSFGLDVNVANAQGGKLMADVSLMVDSVKTVTATGVLNDSTSSSPFLLDFNMIKFPLRVVNPFIPEGMATLSGMLNGQMKISGEMTSPIFNGFLDFDSTDVKVQMLGTTFAFSEEKIPVDSNIVKFNDFSIMGCNENPLYVNGTVDIHNLANVAMDLALNAKNIQVVKSDRPKGAEIFGKAFLDIDANAKGNMNFLNVDADVALLSGTNVTYVVTTANQALTSQDNSDMVHFVQFNDTMQVIESDSLVNTAMALNLDAKLHIEEGATINVYLNTNGSNRAQVLPSGDITYTMSALNGDRVTGRININGGYVRYTPPFMSEKYFKFQEGSYIAFNGNMLNPILNVSAVDEMRANVTQSGQNSRLVNFDVLLSVTNTLQDMNVAFDLSTNDDITVQNELASMSQEQRANQAMNLLLYNVYTGADTKASANLSGNPLYSFLTSQLNTWAANNIRGVDISFGIDQYDKTLDGSTSTATSYSYRVSKTLFNDRFKIVIGGNYSTDANSDENFSQNLINDVSFEYMLNKSGTMYVRIFRHTGYESILEGEITQTGVGFVLKRKLNSLWELFGIRRD